MNRNSNPTASGFEYPTPVPKIPIPTRAVEIYPTIVHTPETLARLSDSLLINPPAITGVVKDGEEMEVRTYQPAPNTNLTEIKLMYPKGLQDSKDLDYAKKLYNYADAIGAKGTRDTAIDLNGFLDWLEYKRDKDNTHQIKNKKEVWRGIYHISKTDITTKLRYIVRQGKHKNIQETVMSEVPVISSLVGIYREGGKDVEVTEFRETPPYKIMLKFYEFFITELQGKQLEDGGYVTKNLVVAPKLGVSDLTGKYQGYASKLLEYIFLKLKESQPTSGVRNYHVNELVKRASNHSRPDMAKKRLMESLNLFEHGKHIKAWGFRKTLKAKQGSKLKQYNKSPFIWIDFNGTPVFKALLKYKHQTTTNKRFEKLEGESRDNKIKIKEVQKQVDDL